LPWAAFGVCRPPIAQDRLEEQANGKLRYSIRYAMFSAKTSGAELAALAGLGGWPK
jgi:hypothetical protein